jgi:hypothetical protein
VSRSPVPWKATLPRRSDDALLASHIVDKDGIAIAQLAMHDEQRVIANARLLAASPKLLSLAEQFKATVEYYIRIDEKNGDGEGAALKRNTLMLINDAIAEATGAR